MKKFLFIVLFIVIFGFLRSQGVKNYDWRILMTTRLVPIFPFNIQNYVYGLTEINFFKYWVLSTLFTIPGKFILIIFTKIIVNN